MSRSAVSWEHLVSFAHFGSRQFALKAIKEAVEARRCRSLIDVAQRFPVARLGDHGGQCVCAPSMARPRQPRTIPATGSVERPLCVFSRVP